MDDLPLRDDLRGRTPYGAPQLDVPVRLNTNENSFPLPQGLIDDIGTVAREIAGSLNRYPDRDLTDLRKDLAAYLGHGLGPEQIWAASGSNEVLQQLLQAFGGPGRSVLGFTPTYSMYPIYATSTATRYVEGHRAGDFTMSPEQTVLAVKEHRPDIVILCSPNNPTGTALDLAVVEAVLEVAPGIVIVDEAYAEFARAGTRSALTLLPGHPRLVVSRTMSKAFGMAGLRLGYFAADPAMVDAVQLVRLPYHLSALTQAAARVALSYQDELLATVDRLKEQRDRMVHELRGMGLSVVPSDANFLLFGEFEDSHTAWQALVDRGVLVRDVGIAHWLRVSSGTPEEVGAFLSAMGAVMDQERAR
ncbi:MAG TPA: histidinol-phosphate transaminase [Mycobacteriales bacterium]|nr:histidinol-phosphate transaminase [Mycobacteriales bacterium]